MNTVITLTSMNLIMKDDGKKIIILAHMSYIITFEFKYDCLL